MTAQDVSLGDQGAKGDAAASRRGQRSFRLCVGACLALTLVLTYSEGYGRFDTAERLYVRSLTHEFESARSFLRQAVRTDQRSRGSPTAKYLEALAFREEEDLVLPTYDRAYKLDPRNSYLGIEYGCRLLLEGRAPDARDRFREAAANPPENALPLYLEAAALLLETENDNQALTQSFALVERANNSGKPVVFPRPLWFSELPENSMWYAYLRRRTVDECCAPLYEYLTRVTRLARKDIESGGAGDWASRLGLLRAMGMKLVAGNDVGTVQATAGVRVQLEVVRLLERARAARAGAADEELASSRGRLETALGILNQFEDERPARIEEDRARYSFPGSICAVAALVFFGAYFLSWCGCRLLGVGVKSLAVPHGAIGRVIFVGAFVLLSVLLTAVIPIQRLAPPNSFWFRTVAWTWYVIVGVFAALGVIYPSLRPMRAEEAVKRLDEDQRSSIVGGSGRRRGLTYVSVMRRYYGVLSGLFLCALCAWVILYRIVTSLYPWQVKLLTTGLLTEEGEVVRHVVDLIL